MTISEVHTSSPVSVALREGAADNPAMVALEIDERQVTYGELNEQADRLAHRLVAELGPRDRIVLRCTGMHELAVGLLAVQRAGMVAVPIDPAAPSERVQTILADVEPSLMLSDLEGDEALGCPVAHPLAFGAQEEATPIERGLGELVSIAYTSGSTGSPKGIMQGRDYLASMSNWFSDFDLRPGSRYGGIAAGAALNTQLRLAFLLRGSFVAYDIRTHGLAELGPWLEHSGLIAFATVPTVVRYLLPTLPADQRFPTLRVVSLFGETATWEDVGRLRRHLHPKAVIVNNLGLSEVSGVARLVIRGDMPLGEGPLPAGTVPPEVEVAIVDSEGRPAHNGERGEIVVRSRTVALGYWGRPDLTRASFRELDDGRREMRTGDAGRLRADGTLEHLGRLDHMVKISGNRVELGEIEHELTRLDSVDAAAVAAYADESQMTQLAACVVPARGALVDPRALRATLARRLPGYMVPHRIVVADELPRLPGGKVDRAQIPELPASPALGDDTTTPASELERSLQSIWEEVLGVEHVNLDDDFFEIGGDSMQAARMFVELDRRLGIDRPLSLLAEAPTIASLAPMLRGDDADWDALLAFQTEGSQPPLFVVHDGAGGVLNARGLVAELADQPIYALRPQAMNGLPPPESSIPELAATYVSKIQALYPHGPYLLYGASLGGVIALDMARQLLSAGEPVALVAMGDTMRPEPPNPVISRVIGHRLRSHHRVMKEMSSAQRVQHLFTTARRVIHRQARGEPSQLRTENLNLERARQGQPIPVAERSNYMKRIYAPLVAGYLPRPPFPERVLLLRTGGPGKHPDRGWQPILGDRLEIIDLPGSHPALGRERSGPYVAHALKVALGRTAA